MASIQKITRKTTDPETGKSKQCSSYRVFIRHRGLRAITKTFTTKKLASAFAVRMESDREAALAYGDGRARSRTINEMCDHYLETWTGKDVTRKRRVTWWKTQIGHLTLADMDQDIILDQIKRLAKGTDKVIADSKSVPKNNKPRSPATINRYVSALSVVYQEAISWRWITINPCRGIRRGKENNHFERFLSDDERDRLMIACLESEWKPLHLLISMALSTGARRGELLGLRWRDINFKNQTAMLHDTKNGKPRVLPLLTSIIHELKQFSKVRRLDNELVFSGNKSDKPYTIEKPWKKALKQAHIENFRFHDLRHSCASYLAMNGVSEITIATLLGHQTMSMVKRYSHLNTQYKQQVVNEVFGNLFGNNKHVG